MKPKFQILDPAPAHFQEQLFKLGITTWLANNDVLQGIATVSRLLENGQLVVTDRCAGFIGEVTEYAWDPKATANGEEAPVKENDDSCDAGWYVAHTTRQQNERDLAA